MDETLSRWKRNLFIGTIVTSGIAAAIHWLLS